ncbi:DUF72 domain-containing protein [Caldinitratiruptor microaerophilus]|uniref:DUF72 domain-containing protein n=1 Tax=Caldinitratiruptor microaerophilus TaxID=671077 RepID=A0AA35G7Z1_9FIRM|nr:DUF72 domain-containing protein [Caldinitratiruptor microaerophilus]BDG60425.1 hypothetical protein caldi_15150 [Caldinitratiruptor microaerophilus]
MGRVRVGTCAWSDHEAFYPPGLPARERLSYYARFFRLVEVDSTFYALQPARNFALWADRTPEDFLFNVKAYGALTRHHRQPRPGEEDLGQVFRRFSESLAPLRAAGKLRAVHLQFPPWFTATRESESYLRYCREALPHDLLAVEFRHRSWFHQGRAEETLRFLREHEMVHVVCDEPQVGWGCVPLVPAVTHPGLSILRLHGRNAATWYKSGKTSAERFDYLYSRTELAGLLGVVRRLEADAGEVHVLMNNNRSNYAVRNALDMLELLGEPVPPRDESGSPVMA